MTKKMALIAVEFDDPDNNFEDASDLATFVDGLLSQRLTGVDVTVYSTPEAVLADTNDGVGIFAKDRSGAAESIKSAAETEYAQTSKFG
jgi:hypothetical protein